MAFDNTKLSRGLYNGQIVATVAANNLTLAIKTLAGNDPTPTDWVGVVINNTFRQVTAALSLTLNAGTNWFNSGGAELATNEIDYPVYVGWNATDSVFVLAFARRFGNQWGDFSTTSTSENYLAASYTTNAASTDYYQTIGRFAATLSAGAGYTWTVPTFTAINLIQYPIYETRWLTWTPVYAGFSADPTDTVSRYKIRTNVVMLEHGEVTAGTSSTTAFTITIPFSSANITNAQWACAISVVNNGTLATAPGRFRITANTNVANVDRDYAATAWTGSGSKRCNGVTVFYEI